MILYDVFGNINKKLDVSPEGCQCQNYTSSSVMVDMIVVGTKDLFLKNLKVGLGDQKHPPH